MKSQRKRYALVAAGALAAVVVGSTASAGMSSVFTNEGAFLSATSSPLFENFESFSIDGNVNQRSVLTCDGLTITAGNEYLSVFDSPVSGAQGTNGDHYMFISSMGMSVTFTFDTPVQMFGLHITDWGDAGTGSLMYADDGGNQHTIAPAPQSDGNILFFGIASESAVTQVTLTRNNVYEGFGIDNVIFQNIPAPGALALLGVAGLLVSRRRRPA